MATKLRFIYGACDGGVRSDYRHDTAGHITANGSDHASLWRGVLRDCYPAPTQKERDSRGVIFASAGGFRGKNYEVSNFEALDCQL
jgi:hypothetical protein